MPDPEENVPSDTPDHPGSAQAAAAAAAIRAARAEITVRLDESMYADPFWLERFGERGRRAFRLAARREESLDFLSYLLDAVEKNEPGIFLDPIDWTLTHRPAHDVPVSVLHLIRAAACNRT